MNHSTFAAPALAGLLAVSSLALAPQPAFADSGSRHHQSKSWHGPKGGGDAMRGHCRRAAGLGHRIDMVEEMFDFSAPQQAAWTKLKGEVEGSLEDLKKACKAVDDDLDRDAKLVERMQAMEKMAVAQAAAMQRINPALSEFYALLSDKQKRLLDRMGGRRHGRHHD